MKGTIECCVMCELNEGGSLVLLQSSSEVSWEKTLFAKILLTMLLRLHEQP